MTDSSIYALLAATAYNDIRQRDLNKAPTPIASGWSELTQYASSNANATGFSAKVFRGPGGEVVISFAGTEFDTTASGLADWVSGNVLSSGLYGAQALEAARLYQRVKAGVGGNITFTGHSLGGGLASLMAVWFARPAKVFAAAPFQASADSTQPRLAGSGVTAALYEVKRLLALEGPVDPALANYDPTIDFAAREANVQAWAVKGEVLEANLGGFSWIEGSSTGLLTDPATQLGSRQKHSIDLHAAALLSTTFNEWAAKIPTALPRMFDEALYGNDPLGNAPDFLIKLVRNDYAAAGRHYGTAHSLRKLMAQDGLRG